MIVDGLIMAMVDFFNDPLFDLVDPGPDGVSDATLFLGRSPLFPDGLFDNMSPSNQVGVLLPHLLLPCLFNLRID